MTYTNNCTWRFTQKVARHQKKNQYTSEHCFKYIKHIYLIPEIELNMRI